MKLQKVSNGGVIINRSGIYGTDPYYKRGHLDEIVAYRNRFTG